MTRTAVPAPSDDLAYEAFGAVSAEVAPISVLPRRWSPDRDKRVAPAQGLQLSRGAAS